MNGAWATRFHLSNLSASYGVFARQKCLLSGGFSGPHRLQIVQPITGWIAGVPSALHALVTATGEHRQCKTYREHVPRSDRAGEALKAVANIVE